MQNRFFLKSSLVFMSFIFAAGCATTKARRAEPSMDQNAQIAQLQTELAEKDRQIQEMQYQLESYKSSVKSAPNFSKSSGSNVSSSIRVSGVSVEDVQRALAAAGFDPGPADGRMGKKTKAAVKEFQRRSNLAADGIVGERTWSYLKS
ncbi:MAG: peptidoglycan-binding domain-containing protein [Candidatus Omnitrophota bacterium]